MGTRLVKYSVSLVHCPLAAVAVELVVVHSQQQLRQVRGRAMHLDPGDDIKEESRLSGEILGDTFHFHLLPDRELKVLGVLQ